MLTRVPSLILILAGLAYGPASGHLRGSMASSHVAGAHPFCRRSGQPISSLAGWGAAAQGLLLPGRRQSRIEARRLPWPDNLAEFRSPPELGPFHLIPLRASAPDRYSALERHVGAQSQAQGRRADSGHGRRSFVGRRTEIVARRSFALGWRQSRLEARCSPMQTHAVVSRRTRGRHRSIPLGVEP